MSFEIDPLLPEDETDDRLKQMADAGEEMDRPREIDFYFEFPAVPQAEAFMRELGDPLAIATEHSMDQRVVICVSKTLIPTSHAIADTQTRWTHLAVLHHGSFDGWCCAASRRRRR